jgi:23S rRNA (guanosine2251-2'-O)-methyltransferase
MESIVVILHNIRSIHNVGSIFRTADAAGVVKLYLAGITPTPLDRFGVVRKDFHKASLGAEKYVQWERAGAASRLLARLRKDGYKIFAVEQAKNSIPYREVSKFYIPNSKFCFVFGNEVKGLPSSLLSRADVVLEIPMRGKKESLNVSVAFGIVVFEVVKISCS